MTPSDERVMAGQAVYTRRTLRLYDFVVLGFSNRLIWRCPTPGIVEHYNTNVSANHLDVGVGTGYLLDHCRFPASQPRVGLMDMNPGTLAYASERIARYSPQTFEQNVLEPVGHAIEPFDSVGLNYLFHCVPGPIAQKAVAFDHLRPLMNPGCRVFGSTILQGGVRRSWAAKRLMAFYNGKGIFSNTQDTAEGLEQALSARFEDVGLRIVGCVALFSGRLAG